MHTFCPAVVDKAGVADQFDIDSCGTGGGSSNWYLPGGFRQAPPAPPGGASSGFSLRYDAIEDAT